MAAPAAMPEFCGNVAAVEAAPYWDDALARIALKHRKVEGMAYSLRTEHQDYANRNGTMTPEQQRAYVQEYRATLVTAEEDAFWQRAASSQGDHYFGSAKTLALIGQAFAEAALEMEKQD
ncbi:MAG: hypothetical protein ACF8NJ_11340 [Phycisphaerales bacterium JB038]